MNETKYRWFHSHCLHVTRSLSSSVSASPLGATSRQPSVGSSQRSQSCLSCPSMHCSGSPLRPADLHSQSGEKQLKPRLLPAPHYRSSSPCLSSQPPVALPSPPPSNMAAAPRGARRRLSLWLRFSRSSRRYRSSWEPTAVSRCDSVCMKFTAEWKTKNQTTKN